MNPQLTLKRTDVAYMCQHFITFGDLSYDDWDEENVIEFYPVLQWGKERGWCTPEVKVYVENIKSSPENFLEYFPNMSKRDPMYIALFGKE